MDKKWYILTLFGMDQIGIVAKTTDELYRLGANLSETSMSRLGDYFTIMAFIEYEGDRQALQSCLEEVANSMTLRFHLDELSSHEHPQVIPNVRITFYGTDRAGLVAKVTKELSDCQVNITDLQTGVSEDPDQALFVMSIEGVAQQGLEPLNVAIADLKSQGIDIHVDAIDTMIG